MEDTVTIIEVKESIFADNNADAEKLRQELKGKKICLMNLMSAPGSGKTSTLLALNKYFKNEISWGVLEADIDGDCDALTMINHGVPSIQIHTGGMCHLDADMVRQGIRAFNHDELDFMVLENVGNLVCPAEFDTGAAINMTILSVPEGDDKPLKYPLMYEVSDILVINKTDAMAVFDFDKAKVEQYAFKRNPDIRIFYVSAKTGEGIDKLASYLLSQVKEWNK